VTRRAPLFLGTLVLAALCGYVQPPYPLGPFPQGPSSLGPLRVGPGAGVRTMMSSMLRPLRDDVRVVPILSVGDTLAPADTQTIPYVFLPMPDGLGMRTMQKGVAEIYVAHHLAYGSVFRGAWVSRLAIDLRNLGVLGGDMLVNGDQGYSRLSTMSLVGSREGFLSPTLLMNEESVNGPFHGITTAVDPRDGSVTPLPWLGFFSHEATVIVPVSSGKLVAILTEDGPPGGSQLYMYLAENDADFLAGRGRLYVFRADPARGRTNTRLSSMADKFRPLTGRFVPVGMDFSRPASEQPDDLESAAQSAGCLNFVRLEDAVADRTEPNVFYVADCGSEDLADPTTGRPVTGAGRVYSFTLDPFNPTIVREMAVLLDGDAADDIYRPDNMDADDRYLWIQEDPGSTRGLHTARVLRYDLQAHRLDAMAECVETDPKGRLLPKGVGGVWESTGILNVSDILGPDTWLLAVDAPNLEATPFRSHGGGGQLLILRGPGSPREKPAKSSAPKTQN